MSDSKRQIELFFRVFGKYFDDKAPKIIAGTAVEYYKGRFTEKAFDGKSWPALSKRYKPRGGSMMVRSSKLMNSINAPVIEAKRVIVSAGNANVPYARIHNEGGEIKRAARSETFRRNRNKSGKFRKGTTAGKGFGFKASVVRMPQRQFIGYAQELNSKIIQRIKAQYPFK